MRARAERIGVIGGAGWLGGAIVESLLRTQIVYPEDLTLSYRTKRPDRYPGACWTQNNQELVDRSHVVILSVRPQDWPSITVDASGKLIISVMAGIRLEQIVTRHKSERVVRALPNAGAEVGQSYTPWIAAPALSDADRVLVRAIVGACGPEDEVSSEADIDYLTGLSGSGPAFPALLASAMLKHALAQGISVAVAGRAVETLLVGAGRLLERHHEHPDDTVASFLDYRGTTAAAIEAMRGAGFDTAVAAGLSAAATKSASMGDAPA
jgi:pyrroline-5-carboxylate reductase